MIRTAQHSAKPEIEANFKNCLLVVGRNICMDASVDGISNSNDESDSGGDWFPPEEKTLQPVL